MRAGNLGARPARRAADPAAADPDRPPKKAHYVHGEADSPCKFLIVQGVGVYGFVAVDA
jgi:hypothetical protein